MKKLIKEGILEKIKDKNLYIFLAITIIFFGVFILKDYTVDSYLFFQETWREPFYHLASLGRLVTAIFWLIFLGQILILLTLHHFCLLLYLLHLVCMNVIVF